MDTVETFEVNGYTVKIHPDHDGDGSGNPRDADNVGVMFANGHRNYTLGDEPFKGHIPEFALAEQIFEDWEDDSGVNAVLVQRFIDELGARVVLPLFLLDHSGLAMRTGPFHEDPGQWDSGVVGFIFDTPRTREQTLGTDSTNEQIEAALRHEVTDYDSYLQGDVYGYTIENPEGEHVDSCWGYLGDEYVKEAATEAAQGQDPIQWVVVTGGVTSRLTVQGPYDVRADAQADAGERDTVMYLNPPPNRVYSMVTPVDYEPIGHYKAGDTFSFQLNAKQYREYLAKGWTLAPITRKEAI